MEEKALEENELNFKGEKALNVRLEQAKLDGHIKDWKLIDIDEDGNEGSKGPFRNTEKLVLTFPNNKTLVIGTFCSGSGENSCFI